LLVEQLSDGWGFYKPEKPGGKVVWAAILARQVRSSTVLTE